MSEQQQQTAPAAPVHQPGNNNPASVVVQVPAPVVAAAPVMYAPQPIPQPIPAHHHLPPQMYATPVAGTPQPYPSYYPMPSQQPQPQVVLGSNAMTEVAVAGAKWLFGKDSMTVLVFVAIAVVYYASPLLTLKTWNMEHVGELNSGLEKVTDDHQKSLDKVIEAVKDERKMWQGEVEKLHRRQSAVIEKIESEPLSTTKRPYVRKPKPTPPVGDGADGGGDTSEATPLASAP